jgi:hypothetical protein
LPSSHLSPSTPFLFVVVVVVVWIFFFFSFFLSFFRVLCPDERIGIEFAILFCRKFLVAFVVGFVVFSRRFGSSSFFFFFFYCANLFFSLASPHDTGILQ